MKYFWWTFQLFKRVYLSRKLLIDVLWSFSSCSGFNSDARLKFLIDPTAYINMQNSQHNIFNILNCLEQINTFWYKGILLTPYTAYQKIPQFIRGFSAQRKALHGIEEIYCTESHLLLGMSAQYRSSPTCSCWLWPHRDGQLQTEASHAGADLWKLTHFALSHTSHWPSGCEIQCMPILNENSVPKESKRHYNEKKTTERWTSSSQGRRGICTD